MSGSSNNKSKNCSNRKKPVQKLRTAEDVLHRLRWCPLPEEKGAVMIGYDDRVRGPMETALDDFSSIQEGGDIPEHRIWYFRCQPPSLVLSTTTEPTPGSEQHVDQTDPNALESVSQRPTGDASDDSIEAASEEANPHDPISRLNDTEINDMVLWDRLGKVDMLFGSGVGKSPHKISPTTTQNIRAAISNMQQIDAERLERRQQRDHERQRLAAKRQARKQGLGISAANDDDKNMSSVGATFATAASENKASNHNGTVATANNNSSHAHRREQERYTWHATGHFDYSKEEGSWKPSEVHELGRSTSTNESMDRELKIVSWNVLFDLHNDHDNNIVDVTETRQAEENSEDDIRRWTKLIAELAGSDADIIALQEVTPTFLDLLVSSRWVQDKFCLSAAPGHTETVTPSGNMVLWCRSQDRLRPLSAWICRDGAVKQRSNMVLLEWNHVVLLIANLHLLADPLQRSAAAARHRELSSVIGQLQILESKLWQRQNQPNNNRIRATVPIVLGDFNANEQQKELQNGCFEGEAVLGNRFSQGFFVDTWAVLQKSSMPDQLSDGFTFDPRTNSRAKRTRALTTQTLAPKRNDRIYIARQWTSQDPTDDIALLPISGELLCQNDSMPPSDHFGLSISFRQGPLLNHPATGPTLCNPGHIERNAWAASAESTVDSLLGIVLGRSVVGGVSFCDSSSTLPIPHITMLHGFADFGSSQGKSLALQACTNAVDHFLKHQEHDHQDGFSLTFSPSCLEVLSHQSSATLVASPEMERESSSWLRHLYECLIGTFRRCHQQESRFDSGWKPHVSLGQYGSSITARSRLVELRESERWLTEDCVIPVYAITLFQRYKVDGKIYAVASVPLSRKPPSPCRHPRIVNTVFSDMGESWSRYFRGQCQALILEVDRACRHCASVLNCGRASIIPTGSYAIGVGLPDISDIDAVVQVRATDTSVRISSRLFFHELAQHLVAIHPGAKIRSRVAGTSTAPLEILTVKLWPWVPPIDMVMSFLDTSDKPVDNGSLRAYRTIDDIEAIRRAFEGIGGDEFGPYRLFQGVLRVVKLWAYRENIYGASMGYLGGGGFSVLVARVLLDGYRCGTLSLNDSITATNYFFETASRWTSIIFTLSPELEGKEVTRREMDRAISRGTMCVLAPSSDGNHGRNSLKATTRATLSSFANAQMLKAESLFENQPSIAEKAETLYSHAIRLQIGIDKSILLGGGAAEGTTERPLMAEIKAWGNSHVLRVLGDLERRFATFCDHVRLFSNSIKSTNGPTLYIVWFMGVDCFSDSVAAYLEHYSDVWNKETRSELPDLYQSITTNVGFIDMNKDTLFK